MFFILPDFLIFIIFFGANLIPQTPPPPHPIPPSPILRCLTLSLMLSIINVRYFIFKIIFENLVSRTPK